MRQIVLVVLMALSVGVYAQNLVVSSGTEQRPGPLALKVGDLLPNLPLAKVLVNGKLVDLTTRDYNDKLLILDFWDTYCSACVAAFPRLDQVQKTFGNQQLQIITITWQKEAEIRKFKEENKFAKPFTVPMMVEDTLLRARFPHRFISHTVWVNKGRVIAISSSEYVDEKVVKRVLNGEKITLPLKNDFVSYDFQHASILGEVEATNKKAYSVILGYKEGVTANGPESATIIDSVNGLVKDVYLNVQPARLYLGLSMTIQPVTGILKPSMFIVEASHPERYDMQYMKQDEFRQDWERKYAICYESVLPATLDRKERARLMLADLENKLGMHGGMEMRSIKTWVIKKATGTKPVVNEAQDGKSSSKQPFQQFMMLLLYNNMDDFLPIVDESDTKADQLIDVYGYGSMMYKDKASLKRVLNLNGLDLVEDIRPIEVFVLKETRNDLVNPGTTKNQ